jgi:hypothetical protein
MAPALASATPTLTPLFHLIMLNRSVPDTKEQIAHGRELTTRDRSSHFTAAHHSIAHRHHIIPGIELNVDQGKAVPPVSNRKSEPSRQTSIPQARGLFRPASS